MAHSVMLGGILSLVFVLLHGHTYMQKPPAIGRKITVDHTAAVTFALTDNSAAIRIEEVCLGQDPMSTLRFCLPSRTSSFFRFPRSHRTNMPAAAHCQDGAYVHGA